MKSEFRIAWLAASACHAEGSGSFRKRPSR